MIRKHVKLWNKNNVKHKSQTQKTVNISTRHSLLGEFYLPEGALGIRVDLNYPAAQRHQGPIQGNNRKRVKERSLFANCE